MYTETQLSKLIEDVEKEFTAHLTKAEEDFKSLAKSEEAPSETLVKAEEEKKPEAKEDNEKKDHEDKAPEAEKKPEEKAAEEKPAEHKEHAEGDDHCDYDDKDLEHMHKMYMSMSKGELKTHHDSCKKALDHKGMAECGDMAQEKTMAKSEDIKPVEVKVEAQPSPEMELVKSELTDTKTKYEELKKNFDAVSAFITKLVEKRAAPVGKAITSLDVITKSEGSNEEKTLSKSEIDQILLKKSADPSLKKSDRDAINAFYLNNTGINSISHLLK